MSEFLRAVLLLLGGTALIWLLTCIVLWYFLFGGWN